MSPPPPEDALSPAFSAFAFTSVVCLSFPAVIYHSNAGDIDIAFGYIAMVLLPLSIVFAIVLSLAGRLLQGRNKRIYSTILGTLAIATWATGTFLISERGLLNGEQLLRSDSPVYQRTELAAILLGCGVILFIGLKAAKVFQSILLVLILMSLGVAGFAIATDTKGYSSKAEADSFYRVSSSKNVFVFLFDAFLSDFFEDMLKNEPRLAEEFDGFTYFSKAAGVAPTTYLSLPAIHSGIQYRESLSLKEYYRRGIRNGSFLSSLARSGYDAAGINFVQATPQMVSGFQGKEMSEGRWRTAAKEAFFLFDISLWRSSPSILKNSVYDDGEWFTTKIFDSGQAIENNRLLDFIGKNFHRAYDKPCVRWMHLYNTHPPASVDADCNRVRHQKWNRQNGQNQAECAVYHFVQAMREFKKNGVYDNSLILLIADHGVAFSRDMRPPQLSSAHPIFLIKPIGKRGKLQTSETSVFLTDVAKTVCALTGDCDVPTGLSVFDNAQDRNNRAITFYEYKWRNAYWSLKHLPLLARYIIAGPVDDVLSWYKKIPPQAVRSLRLSFNEKDDPDAFGLGWTEVKKGQSRSVLGRYAQVYLPLQPGKDASLDMQLRTQEGNRNQYLTLFVNNEEAGGKSISPGEENQLTFEIPGRYVTKPLTRITFVFRQTHEHEHGIERNRERLEAIAATFNELNARY